MVFWIISAFIPLALANYGAPVADYNPPAADYNTAPAVVAQPVYVQVQPPAPLPEMPAFHELLYKRKNRDSRSSEEKRCYGCKDIKRKCDSTTENCNKPNISYLKCDGCRRAIISCPGDATQTLQTIDGQVLSTGVGIQKFAKCHKKRWTAKDPSGDKINFKHLICVEEN